jgi:hypothetical protein
VVTAVYTPTDALSHARTPPRIKRPAHLGQTARFYPLSNKTQHNFAATSKPDHAPRHIATFTPLA